MIPYETLKKFFKTAQIELKKIDTFTKKETKKWKQELLETCNDYKEIMDKYPNLANRLTSQTYKITLQKLIPIILKVKKNTI